MTILSFVLSCFGWLWRFPNCLCTGFTGFLLELVACLNWRISLQWKCLNWVSNNPFFQDFSKTFASHPRLVRVIANSRHYSSLFFYNFNLFINPRLPAFYLNFQIEACIQANILPHNMVYKHHQMYIRMELHLLMVLILEQNLGIFTVISLNSVNILVMNFSLNFSKDSCFQLFYAFMKFTHGGFSSFSMCPSASWSGCSAVPISQKAIK